LVSAQKTSTKKRKHRKKTVTQCHHIIYDPPWTVIVFKGEHYVLSQLQWRKHFSKGFMTSLHYFLEIHEKEAVDLALKTE
jgi:hypothetical protein